MTLRKRCLGCGRLTDGASRCASCHMAWQRRQRRRSPSSRVTQRAEYRRVRQAGPPWRCHLCGHLILSRGDLHLDHVQPVSRGGGVLNIAPAHRSCNLGKGASLSAGLP
jgi:5-methylcytosine-specific restriction endonuclease McrA